MSVLHVQSIRGDDRTEWTPGDPASERRAREAFDAARRMGMMAYTVDEETKRAEHVQGFVPEADRIVLRAPLVGG
jgi:hypothetical protein